MNKIKKFFLSPRSVLTTSLLVLSTIVITYGLLTSSVARDILLAFAVVILGFASLGYLLVSFIHDSWNPKHGIHKFYLW